MMPFLPSSPPVRIGAVSYLNTKPLIATLEAKLPPGSQLILDLPSVLADRLASGAIDVGLIPAIEYFRGLRATESFSSSDRYQILSNACIACRGPVRSVRLFFRVPPPRVRTLSIDQGSRTSVALASILLADRFGIQPQLVSLPIDANPENSPSDAVLLIGDRAMRPEQYSGFEENWDLGEEWYRHTGLPFVFAMWVARKGVASDYLASQLEQARDEGLQMVERLSHDFARSYELTVRECVEYLSINLRFTMEADERKGLQTFHRMAIDRGLVEPPSPRDTSPTSSQYLPRFVKS